MSKLGEQIQETLLPGMHLPGELEQLFTWIEANGLYVDRPTGERDGFLFPDQELREGWTETERPGGTIIQFHPEGNALLKYWFGADATAIVRHPDDMSTENSPDPFNRWVAENVD